MIKLFAKYGTTEKVLIVCEKEQVRDVQIKLSKKYGGDWLWVDKLYPRSEILKFNDGLKYLGFHGRDERYVNGIDTL